MTDVWISAAGLCDATIIGAILGFIIKELPHKWNDTFANGTKVVLGYCAGIMLAASTLGLIVPAFEAPSISPQGGELLQYALITAGVMFGAYQHRLCSLVS